MSECDSYPLWHPYTSAREEPPLCVKRAYGSRLELADGRIVIDAIGSWWTSLFGHSFPPLVQALQQQAAELDHALFGSVTHEPALAVAELLVKMLGEGKVIFSDCGSMAVEIGMKLASHIVSLRGDRNRTLFASFEGGYHGDAIGVMSLQGKGLFTEPYAALLHQGVKIPFVDTWDGDETVEGREAQALVEIETLLERRGCELIAFVFEPLLQGSSGMRVCRPCFLQNVVRLMRNHGVLLIADEVFTGLGRTGALFACEKAEVDWDFLALSKGLTGGMLPLAVTFLKSAVFREFFQHDAPLFHGHTFTANPIACRVAAKTLSLLLDGPDLFQSFEERYRPYIPEMKKGLRRVRTLGCMWAGEWPGQLSYGSRGSLALRRAFFERGVLARPLGSVLYFLPAYTITEQELDFCFSVVNEVKT